MLYVAYQPSSGGAGLVALGLSLVLVKQADGRWQARPPADRQSLLDTGLSGPPISLPTSCARAGWRWLGRDRGVIHCHDRRVFVWDAGALLPRGTMPRQCLDAFGSIAEANGQLYASCGGASLWRTEGQAWRPIQAPVRAGPSEYVAISVADRCVFVASNKSVWRRCDE
jgi:hypothetical protein